MANLTEDCRKLYLHCGSFSVTHSGKMIKSFPGNSNAELCHKRTGLLFRLMPGKSLDRGYCRLAYIKTWLLSIPTDVCLRKFSFPPDCIIQINYIDAVALNRTPETDASRSPSREFLVS